MTDASPVVSAEFTAYRDAVATVRTAAAAYYTDGSSPMDDDAYDRLMADIAAFEEAHPDQTADDSPTMRVAAGALPDGDVPHTVPMLSLDNAHNEDDLIRFDAGLARRIGRPVSGYHAAAKIDGVAVAARYTGGALTRLVTRGNGTSGADVSHAIGTIVGLPASLSEPVTIEVRGEVVFTKEQFATANAARTAHGDAAFANPRNAVAGTLRATGRAYSTTLTFFAYALVAEPHARLSQTDTMQTLGKLGVRTVADATPTVSMATTAEVLDYIAEVASQRADLPFDIDGIVVKADHPDDQRDAGNGFRAPHWAIAYKLPAVEKQTRLVGIGAEVGRTGLITPRAELEPVIIDGVTVTYASLHNWKAVQDLGLMIGDTVAVRRAGDVIPQVLGPVAALRDGTQTPVAIPESCPGCGGPIDTTQDRWRCAQGRACNLAPNLEYAVGRDQLDIDGLGPRAIAALVEAKAVADVADLFTLTEAQLAAATGSSANAAKIHANIQAAKGRPLTRVLTALGVRSTGREISERIAKHFGTMAAVQAADTETLQQVDGIGGGKAGVIVPELASLAPVIAKLAAAGVNLTEPQPEATGAAGGAADLPLAGMAVVATGTMTGALAEHSRSAVEALIKRAGGRAASSVSKTTALVVAGDKAGSKKAKAESLGIRVVTPDEFAEMVADHL
ncbi:MAG: NAD-dependent DNA ligase LigA [Streptomycetaceae bacterium]|nr:NAD-dependent DNA ligase LigA [Streptomycetaceae bacterium]